MSRASEWVAGRPRPRVDFRDACVSMWVDHAETRLATEAGATTECVMDCGHASGNRRLSVEEAIALARWILDTFGEDK